MTYFQYVDPGQLSSAISEASTESISQTSAILILGISITSLMVGIQRFKYSLLPSSCFLETQAEYYSSTNRLRWLMLQDEADTKDVW